MVNLGEVNRSNSINVSSSSMKISALAAAILTPKFRKLSKEKSSVSKSTSTYGDDFENVTSSIPVFPPTHKPPPPTNDSNENLHSRTKPTNHKNVMINKLRSSNEYCEPFDLLVQNQECIKTETNPEGKVSFEKDIKTKKYNIHTYAYSHNNCLSYSPKVIRTANSITEISSSMPTSISSNDYFQLKNKNINIKYAKDDDSAYSSCCANQSSISAPKILNQKNISNIHISKNDNCDIDEDTLTLDSSAILSASSSSSSPILSIAQSTTKKLNKSPRYDFLNSSSYSSNQALSPNKLIISPEYESVKDSIISDKEKNQTSHNNFAANESQNDLNETHMFKSTISAFDVLTERCSELIDLFDEETQQKKYDSTISNAQTILDHNLEDKKDAYDQEPNIKETRFRHLNSVFLERTLTFNSSMTSSALLSSSRSSFLFSGSSSEVLESVNKNSTEQDSIKKFIFKIAHEEKSLFGKSLYEFINCTSKSKETNPNILMSNARQFMDGIKNYLLKNETELKFLIEKERSSLAQMRILNIDSIVEDCLQSIILRPLKSKIYYLLVDWLICDNSIILMSKNIKKLNSLTEDECIKYLGLKTKVNQKPSDQVLKQIRTFFSKMQCEYSPLIKLKYLLFIINELLISNEEFSSALKDLENLNLVDFMPVVIYSLCKCNLYSMQIELDYIWNLSNKKLLTNETIYYLTLMSSACYIIKNLEPNKLIENHSNMCKSQQESMLTLENNRKSIKISSNVDFTRPFSYMSSGTIEIFITDEKFQTIKMKTIPAKPNSNSKDVCSLIAAKFRIFNCNDYNLCFIENGLEKVLRDDEQPLELKNDKLKHGSNVIFIYKQKNINILWPKI